ncbi:MAG TPA: FadR/GntR family transcriptional regulator [Streptosporangiaceae bacterium]|nr:FadR/GntR family transcriptional regulator [Streptosporangiaceae bacterium]
MPLTQLRRSPLVELAVRQLHQQLTSGQWPEGTRLPAETELAGQLGVGRSTVREAVRALVHAGLLETRQGSGTFVVSLTEGASFEPWLRRAAVLEVYEVREALEVQAARLAAGRRTGADLAALHDHLAARDAAHRSGAADSFVQADLEFHRTVVSAAHNQLLTEMFDSFAAVLREALAAVATDTELADVSVAPTHARLVRAIEAGDADAAEHAARDHIGSSAAILRSPPGR